MAVQTDFPDPPPERTFESGYLIIQTNYEADPELDSTEKASNEIIATARVADYVRRVIEDRESRVKGAVVQSGDSIYVLVSLRASEEAWGENPLQVVADTIFQALGEKEMKASSSIEVTDVKVAKDLKAPSGLQGPP